MTMKAIINDKRYRALDTLSEKKQVLLDFQAEKKKLERVKLFILLHFKKKLKNFTILKGREKKKRYEAKGNFLNYVKGM